MTDLFQEPEDATPLEPEEREGLRLTWVTTRADLNIACPSPLNLGQIDLSGFGGSGGFEDGSEAVFG